MTTEPPQSAPPIERKISMARAALAFERIWAALLWPLLVVGVVAALVLSGVLPLLPVWLRFGLLAVALAALLWSLKSLFRISLPGRSAAIRRVEEHSALAHRPVAGLDDRLVETADPLQKAIWEEHRFRLLSQMSGLKSGLPRSAWRQLDPRALRVPVAIAVVASFFLGPGDPASNLADAMTVTAPVPAAQLTMDAWLKPPAYTGKPPVLLTSPAMRERLTADPEILVPENAVLSIRMANAKAPAITFHELADTPGDTPELKDLKPVNKTAKDAFQSEATLNRPALIVVKDGAQEIARWRVSLIPDAAPTVAITEDPTGDSAGRLSVKWNAGDDYGVTAITSDIYLADEQDDGTGFSSDGIFEFDPPKLAVPLRRSSPKDESGQAKADLSEHPWAGFMVDITLSAKDAAGHETASEKRTFRMPERQFTRPLARALIEQRKHLILAPEEAGGVVQMLDALLTYPKGLYEGSGTQIAMAAVLSRLKASETRADIDTVITMLWQLAVHIEEGSLSDARAELDALRKELERALREGASPERIAELTKKLREAMDRYMQQLAQEGQKRQQSGQKGQAQQQPSRTVTPQELQKMLDMIEKLSQSGANDAAREMLSQLDDILRNLQPGQPQGQQGQMQDSPLGKMLDQLSDLMRQQQKLMDQTQRAPTPGMGTGEEQGQQQDMDGLGDRQQDLSKMLDQLMQQMQQNGMQPPGQLGDAGKSMKGAEGNLRGGDREGALGDQGQAMSKLREGARGIAKQLMQQGQGQQGNQGRTGEARGDDRDPLGRPLPNRGEDTGPDRDMLPSERALQRAREILDLLRERAGETGLPRIERDYIDRLLRGLY